MVITTTITKIIDKMAIIKTEITDIVRTVRIKIGRRIGNISIEGIAIRIIMVTIIGLTKEMVTKILIEVIITTAIVTEEYSVFRKTS